jgi:hypothetical protein
MARYIGSGPYCYANCLAMAMADGTDPGLLEVLTGAPFGRQLLAGTRPLFDPLGWDPEAGIDTALGLLGCPATIRAPGPPSGPTTTCWSSRPRMASSTSTTRMATHTPRCHGRTSRLPGGASRSATRRTST